MPQLRRKWQNTNERTSQGIVYNLETGTVTKSQMEKVCICRSQRLRSFGKKRQRCMNQLVSVAGKMSFNNYVMMARSKAREWESHPALIQRLLLECHFNPSKRISYLETKPWNRKTTTTTENIFRNFFFLIFISFHLESLIRRNQSVVHSVGRWSNWKIVAPSRDCQALVRVRACNWCLINRPNE